MTQRRFTGRIRPGASSLAIAAGLAAPVSQASEPPVVQGAPTGHQGFETQKQQAVPLDAEIPGMEGRQLRVRLLTLEPGGHIKGHSHNNRPAVFYAIQGATTISSGDGTVKRFPAGSMGYADRNTLHWHMNHEQVPVISVAADIFQPRSQ